MTWVRSEIVTSFHLCVVCVSKVGICRRLHFLDGWTFVLILPTAPLWILLLRLCGGTFLHAFFVLRFRGWGRSGIWLFCLPCPMAYRRIRLLFDRFGCIRSSIWLLPGCTLSFILVSLFALDFGRVVPLLVLGVYDCSGLSWSSSSSSMFVLATRAILSWLLHFSHGIGGLLLGLSQKGWSPRAVRPILSDCAMLYSISLTLVECSNVKAKAL